MLWEIATTDWFVLVAFMSGMSYITGWFTDRILDTTGFGNIGNWLLIFSGSYGGLYIYNMQGYELHWDPVQTLGVIIGGAFLALFTACLAKRFLLT